MEVIKYNGDIFNLQVETIINPVNICGVMGKGLALEFKNKYPELFKMYKYKCDKKEFKIGDVLVHFPPETNENILSSIVNFPTKVHWKDNSEYYIIEESLCALANFCNIHQINSLAIPPVGCGLGGLDKEHVESLIRHIFLPRVQKYLKKIYLVNF